MDTTSQRVYVLKCYHLNGKYSKPAVQQYENSYQNKNAINNLLSRNVVTNVKHINTHAIAKVDV